MTGTFFRRCLNNNTPKEVLLLSRRLLPPLPRPPLVSLLSSSPRTPVRRFAAGTSWGQQRGYDLTAESLRFGYRPKVIIDGYSSTGIQVLNIIRRSRHPNTDDKNTAAGGKLTVRNTVTTIVDSQPVILTESMLAFPHGCFLWKIKRGKDVTVESLSPVLLHRPKLKYLFIGIDTSKDDVPQHIVNELQVAFRPHGVVVEKMNLSTAIGTFNFLNGEDRLLALALIMDPDNTDDEQS